MKIKNLITQYYEELKKLGLNKNVNVPDSMRIGDIQKNSWSEWKIDNPLYNSQQVDEFFSEFSLKVPEDYKEYLTAGQFFDIEKDGYKLFGINERDNLNTLISYTPEKLLKQGLISIGTYEDNDYVVLDTKSGKIQLFDFDSLQLKREISKNFRDFITSLLNKEYS